MPNNDFAFRVIFFEIGARLADLGEREDKIQGKLDLTSIDDAVLRSGSQKGDRAALWKVGVNVGDAVCFVRCSDVYDNPGAGGTRTECLANNGAG